MLEIRSWHLTWVGPLNPFELNDDNRGPDNPVQRTWVTTAIHFKPKKNVWVKYLVSINIFISYFWLQQKSKYFSIVGQKMIDIENRYIVLLSCNVSVQAVRKVNFWHLYVCFSSNKLFFLLETIFHRRIYYYNS